MSKNLGATSKYFQACTSLENVSQHYVHYFNFHFKNVFIHPELSQITGVAAILRFPMPELEDDEEEEDDDSDENTPLPPS